MSYLINEGEKKMLKEKRRNVLKINRKEMADRLGVSFETVTHYEQGRVYPKARQIWKLKEAYQLTDEELVQWLKEISKEGDK